MKRKDFDHYVLDSGREIYANDGILGLQIDMKHDAEQPVVQGILTHGYDGYVSSDYDEKGEELDPLTDRERYEIADYMIERWKAWAKL